MGETLNGFIPKSGNFDCVNLDYTSFQVHSFQIGRLTFSAAMRMYQDVNCRTLTVLLSLILPKYLKQKYLETRLC